MALFGCGELINMKEWNGFQGCLVEYGWIGCQGCLVEYGYGTTFKISILVYFPDLDFIKYIKDVKIIFSVFLSQSNLQSSPIGVFRGMLKAPPLKSFIRHILHFSVL